jgi:hypothetical protein
MRDIEALKLIMWAAMIVKLSETNNIEISVFGHKMKGISYLGKVFLPTDLCGDIKPAIAACRRDLDLGLLSVVINDAESYRLWTFVPNEVQGF